LASPSRGYNKRMYLSFSQMRSLPVISLQTGEAVAWVRQPLLDIGTLEIMALRCEGPARHSLILMQRDIRQFAGDCVIVDDEDQLTDPDDIVRLKAILENSYNPLDKHVVSDTGRKLGNVEDYTVNLETKRVQKLHVRQGIFRAWLGANLVIDRTQIIDISPRQIVVRDATVTVPVMQPESMPDTPATS
jgi:sporulation protein YlmC with PRC-barrel domain